MPVEIIYTPESQLRHPGRLIRGTLHDLWALWDDEKVEFSTREAATVETYPPDGVPA